VDEVVDCVVTVQMGRVKLNTFLGIIFYSFPEAFIEVAWL
jgi:hypothetical protein